MAAVGYLVQMQSAKSHRTDSKGTRNHVQRFEIRDKSSRNTWRILLFVIILFICGCFASQIVLIACIYHVLGMLVLYWLVLTVLFFAFNEI